MTDATTKDPETDDEPAADEPADADGPELSAEDRAAVDLDDVDLDQLDDAAKDAAAATAADDSSDADDEDADGDAQPDQEAAEGDEHDDDGLPDMDDGRSAGDVYVAVLSLCAAGIVAAANDDEDVDVEATAEEIQGLSTFGPLDLARDVDRLLAEHGKPTDLPPGVAVAIGTIAVVGGAVVLETDLLDGILDDLTNGGD